MRRFSNWLWNQIISWLTTDSPPSVTPLCDFNRLQYELRPSDILLIEGRSRVAEVIKLITQSPWTHSVIYIGRIYDIHDEILREKIKKHYEGDPEDQLILEANLGEGTVISKVDKYKHDHLRICRPSGLSPGDAQQVLSYSIKRLGMDYDVRQILDFARFFFPWTILPRRWRSSLFQRNAGNATKTVCSCLLAEAFNSVNFPILPFIDRTDEGAVRFFKRNPRLFTPKDFDYSPYFNIIKYPFLGMNDIGLYQRLPWSQQNIVYNDNQTDFLNRIRDPIDEEANKSPNVEDNVHQFPYAPKENGK